MIKCPICLDILLITIEENKIYLSCYNCDYIQFTNFFSNFRIQHF